MSDAYQNMKVGQLTFKGGEVAGTDKSKKRKKKEAANVEDGVARDATVVGGEESSAATRGGGGPGETYTIEELFPVESKKFRYNQANKYHAGARTVEEALDDHIHKKVDRYCK